MDQSVLNSVIMPDIDEFSTLHEAADDPRVPYSVNWLRKLCDDGKVDHRKFGSGRRSVYVIHLPGLLAYVAHMKELDTKKWLNELTSRWQRLTALAEGMGIPDST